MVLSVLGQRKGLFVGRVKDALLEIDPAFLEDFGEEAAAAEAEAKAADEAAMAAAGLNASAVAKANAQKRKSLLERVREALPVLQKHFEAGMNSWEFHLETGIGIQAASPLFTKMYYRGITEKHVVLRDEKRRPLKVAQRQAETDPGDVHFLNAKYKDMLPHQLDKLPPEIPERKMHWKKRFAPKPQ
jgi:hypothetical protein